MDVDLEQLAASTPPPDIDWDDPAAVAKARGDHIEDKEEEEAEEDKEEEEAEEDKEEEEEDKEEEEAEEDKEEEEEHKEEEEAEEAEEPAKKAPMIPKSRLDSKNRRIEELEAKLEEMEAAGPTTAREEAATKQASRLEAIDSEVAELNKKFTQAVLDNDADAVTAIQTQIRQLDRESVKLEMGSSKDESAEAIRTQLKYDLLIDQIEDEYEVLNSKSDDYDQTLVDEVLDLRDGYMAAKGWSPSKALLKAVDLLVPSDTAVEAEEVEDKAAKTRKARQKSALEKSVKASKKQPPNSKKVGKSADSAGVSKSIDPMKMTYADLEKLPLEQLKRMRGDYVE